MNKSTKKFLIRFFTIYLLLFLFTEKSFSLEPKEFVQITVDKASLILSKVVDSKEEKILKLKNIVQKYQNTHLFVDQIEFFCKLPKSNYLFL